MVQIGVRELRRDASHWLARVRAGEVIVVTDRGRPVATMAPYVEERSYDSLLLAGQIAPGRSESLDQLLEAMDAVAPAPTGSAASEALAELRADER